MKKLIISLLTLSTTSLLAYGNKTNKDGFRQTRILSNEVTNSSDQVTGVVLETINAKSYTYMRLKGEKGEFWAASNSVNLKKGERVILDKIYPMDNFHSKTLDRTFKRILFVQNIAVKNEKAR